jgi:hypothetical protein
MQGSKRKEKKSNEGRRGRTIAIDSTVGTWLFAVTLDLFPAAFIAGATDSSALLQW